MRVPAKNHHDFAHLLLCPLVLLRRRAIWKDGAQAQRNGVFEDARNLIHQAVGHGNNALKSEPACLLPLIPQCLSPDVDSDARNRQQGRARLALVRNGDTKARC